MPEISVIVPTYGIPDRLIRTVNSVLEQTYEDLELIVVDDNNPETEARKQTASIMREFIEKDHRVVYLQHEDNKNGSAARNTGIKAAKGKYISLLDSDDEYTPDRLAKCKAALESNDNPKAQGVYTGCEYRKNNQTYRVMKEVKSGNFLVDYLKLNFNLYTGSNIFVTKTAATELHGFDESFIRHQDVEFMIRFFEKYDIIGIPEALVIKNFDGKNKPSANKTEEIKEHFFEVFKETIDSLSKRDQEEIYAAHYRQTAEQFLLERKYKKAIIYYRKVQENHCFTIRYFTRACVYFLRSLKR